MYPSKKAIFHSYVNQRVENSREKSVLPPPRSDLGTAQVRLYAYFHRTTLHQLTTPATPGLPF